MAIRSACASIGKKLSSSKKLAPTGLPCGSVPERRSHFRDDNLRVIVPDGQGRHWVSSDEVGIEASDAQPAILIEMTSSACTRSIRIRKLT
jgi:hypothetical protein